MALSSRPQPRGKWYGVVTLLGEDIVLFIGLAITSNYIANMFDIRLIHHASGFTFWAIVILFCVQIITILCSTVGHLFVFGSTGGFWQCVNKVAQVTNWNFWIVICAFLFLILSLSSGLLGFGEALVWIFYALFSLGSFLLVVCPDPGTEKMIHDPFWGSASEVQKGAYRNVEGKQMLVPYRGSIKDTLREMQEDLQSSISYAGGKDLSAIRVVDYVIVKSSIFDGDK